MADKNYFKRQKKIYLCYTLLPLVLFGEVLIFYYTAADRTWEDMLLFLLDIVLIAEVIIIVIQFAAEIRFLKQINRLTENEKQAFQKRPLLIGPILINDAFVIEYKMFTKRIIPISDIVRAEHLERKYETHARGIFISHVDKKIILLREGKKQIVIKAPKQFMGQETDAVINSINNIIKGKAVRENTKNYYDEYDGDYPFYAMLSVTLLGLIFFVYRCYIPFMDLFIDTKDPVAYFLFHAGFDRYFQIGAVVVIFAYAIGCFVWKAYYLGLDFDSYAKYFAGIFLVFTFMFLCIVFVKDYGNISTQARKDYGNYKKENYGYIETQLIGGVDYFVKARNIWLEDMAKERRIELLLYQNADGSIEFIHVGEELEVQKEKTYQVIYMENTGVIVAIYDK